MAEKDDKLCAPVIIPTLNRFEHLQRLITSLKNNYLASETEVYISVDYPPSEKYMEGYKKVIEYLDAGIDGFKKVHVTKHKENIGSIANSLYLERMIIEKYDRFIYAEDDNVFSKNFLEYMNECLDKYEDNKEVFAVSGYSYPVKWDEITDKEDILVKENVSFVAWGYGIWKDRYCRLFDITKKSIGDYLQSFSRAKKLYQRSHILFNTAVYIAADKHYLALNEKKELVYIDLVEGLYMMFNDKSLIMPTISKVRNIGHDGSGENCTDVFDGTDNIRYDNYDFDNQAIDDRDRYDISVVEEITADKTVEKLLNNYFYIDKKSRIKTWLIWLLKVRFKRKS